MAALPPTATAPGPGPGAEASIAPTTPSPIFPNNEKPGIVLPAAGGSIRSISPAFNVSQATATANLSLPLPLSESRPGPLSKPALSLSYSSGAANGIFGYGWSLSLETVSRKTSNRIPTYTDDDIFQLNGEDLVPRADLQPVQRDGFSVQSFYRRTESAYDRIQRWSSLSDPADVHWRRITADNTTTVFGDSKLSRLSDSEDPTKTFRWLLSAQWDAVGNAILYNHVPEDSFNVDTAASCETNRTPKTRGTNRYLATVNYGNRLPCRFGPNFSAFHPRDLPADQWMFTVVLDYGGPDHGLTQGWACRQDAFSTYAQGFEIRTYRICQQILLFHNFPAFVDAKLPGFLVNTLQFQYSSSALGTFLQSATMKSHSPIPDGQGAFTGTYEPKSLPASTFVYSMPSPVTDLVAQTTSEASLGAFCISKTASNQWIDLHGSGVPGLLSNNGGTLHWRENQSPLVNTPTLDEPTALCQIPGHGPPDLRDVDGRGRPALAVDSGFIAQSDKGTWEEYRPFKHTVKFDPEHPNNLVHLDLTGNGLADSLFFVDGSFLWSRCLGVDGFKSVERVSFAGVQDVMSSIILGPAESPSFFLADMSGDGLVDLVNIQNGRVEYFPNTGYGTFGPKVCMDNSPWFDDPDQFSPQSLRLIDVDGNGTQDLLYLLSSGGAHLYRNASGNGFTPREVISAFPTLHHCANVEAVDLFGKGTGCLVWTSTLPGDENTLQYIDLAPYGKPYLMRSYDNGVGLLTSLDYVSSTKMFLEDRLAGVEWATRLSFPLQCLHSVTTYDAVTQAKKTQRLRYRHGFWDMYEREFRGFGFVESWEGEEGSAVEAWNVSVSSLPSTITHTKSWFHTGLDADHDALSGAYKTEFFSASFPSLPTLALDAGIHGETHHSILRQYHRSLTGQIARQEVYGAGPGETGLVPYTVTENSYQAVLVQPPTTSTAQPVVRIDPAQTLTRTFENGDTSTTRTSHSLNLVWNQWGDVLRSVAVNYGRTDSGVQGSLPQAVLASQRKTSAVITIKEYTNAVDDLDDHIRPAIAEQSSYEVKVPNDLKGVLTMEVTKDLGWHRSDGGVDSAELLSLSRTLFRDQYLQTLPLGSMDSCGIPLTTFKLVWTPELLGKTFADGASSLLEGMDAELESAAGYEDLEGDGRLWIASGREYFSTVGAAASQELQDARSRFFLPVSFVDNFNAVSTISYDRDALHVVASTDAVGNTQTCQVDYRVLKPWSITDMNGNVTEVLFDTLGTPIATALLGPSLKEPLNSLEGINREIPSEEISLFLSQPTLKTAHELLQSASSRLVYQVGPVGTTQVAITREQDSLLEKEHKIQVAIRFLSGRGDEAQAKTLIEPGDSDKPSTWLTTGWKILDNRGNTVKQFEPFFDTSPLLNRSTSGVCTTVDASDGLSRSVASLAPTGLWKRVERTAWSTENWDPGNLVNQDPFASAVAEPKLDQLGVVSKAPWKSRASTSAALRSQVYADAPTVSHLDPFGRDICSEKRIPGSKNTFSYTIRDILGRVTSVFDEMDRLVAVYCYDFVGRCTKQTLMDTGPRWTYPDADGQPRMLWTPRRDLIMTTYDSSRRPVRKTLRERGSSAAQVVELTIYGEADDAPKGGNLRGKVYKSYDQAGVVINKEYGPRGDLRASTREHTEQYKGFVNWTLPETVRLLPEVYQTMATFDALGRQTSKTTPDGSVQVFVYSQGGNLDRVLLRSSTDEDPAKAKALVLQISYNARGQQTITKYGNGVMTTRDYDEFSFLCTRIKSVDTDGRIIQDLGYDFDSMGKVVTLVDAAQQTLFFQNQIVSPRMEYSYDVFGRLTSASGREQLGRTSDASPTLSARSALVKLDERTVSNYTESYKYDTTGNLLEMAHLSDLSSRSWTKKLSLTENSLLEPEKNGNRLSSVTVGLSTETYGYGGALGSDGCMTKIPGFSKVAYNYLDQMTSSARQVVSDTSATPETTYYVYDAAGQRVRKVTEAMQQPGNQDKPVILSETRYVGGLDIITKHRAGSVSTTCSSLRVGQGGKAQTIALCESLQDADGTTKSVYRYQMASHLPSVAVEVGDDGEVLSYEEYSPFGSATLLATAAELKVPKRYRFGGKELDTETGLAYFGMRYYSAAAARWTAADPIGLGDGLNVWAYVGNDPVNGVDLTGLCDEPKEAKTGSSQSLKIKEFVGNLASFTIPLSARPAAAFINFMAAKHWGFSPVTLKGALPQRWSGIFLGQFHMTKDLMNTVRKAPGVGKGLGSFAAGIIGFAFSLPYLVPGGKALYDNREVIKRAYGLIKSKDAAINPKKEEDLSDKGSEPWSDKSDKSATPENTDTRKNEENLPSLTPNIPPGSYDTPPPRGSQTSQHEASDALAFAAFAAAMWFVGNRLFGGVQEFRSSRMF